MGAGYSRGGCSRRFAPNRLLLAVDSKTLALSPFVRPRGVRLVCLRHHIWEQRGVTSGGVKVDRLHGSDIKSAKKTLHQDNFYQKEGIFHRILASTTPENAEGHHKSIRGTSQEHQDQAQRFKPWIRRHHRILCQVALALQLACLTANSPGSIRAIQSSQAYADPVEWPVIEELSPDPVDIFSLPVSMHDEQKTSETYLLQEDIWLRFLDLDCNEAFDDRLDRGR